MEEDIDAALAGAPADEDLLWNAVGDYEEFRAGLAMGGIGVALPPA